MFNYLQQREIHAGSAGHRSGNLENRVPLKATILLLLALSIIPTLSGVASIA